MGTKDFISVRANGPVLVAATRTTVLVSTDKGTSWKQAPLASFITSIRGVTITPDEQILVASREGAFRSGDNGASWEHAVNGLPSKDITSIAYDSTRKRLLATSDATGVVFMSADSGRTWTRGPDSGFPLRGSALSMAAMLRQHRSMAWLFSLKASRKVPRSMGPAARLNWSAFHHGEVPMTSPFAFVVVPSVKAKNT